MAPFSLLYEWLIDPVIVGSFTICIVGIVLSALCYGLEWFFAFKRYPGFSEAFGNASVVAFFATCLCLFSFIVWAL